MKLLESFKLGNLELSNRMVMAPLTRSRSTADHVPQALMATYYGQRATAGLIITEGTSPSINGAGYPRIPGIYNAAQTEAWKQVTQSVHDNGGKIFLQIMHTGRVTHPHNLDEGGKVLAPSAIGLQQTKMYTDQEGELPMPIPEEMSAEELAQAQEEYVQAAKNAIEAGFDGVELHSANGYLMEQFIHPGSNQRSDNYGGTVENRARFVLEVAEKVVAAIGSEKVGIRLSPHGVFNEMGAFEGLDETFGYLAERLSDLGLVYLHLVDHSAMGAPEVPLALKQSLREKFKGAFILSGGYNRDRAEEDLQADKGDLVAFGRPFLANPDLPTRFEKGAALNEPDHNTFYTPGEQGYTDYPTL